jgi:hypothetical protein
MILPMGVGSKREMQTPHLEHAYQAWQDGTTIDEYGHSLFQALFALDSLDFPLLLSGNLHFQGMQVNFDELGPQRLKFFSRRWCVVDDVVAKSEQLETGWACIELGKTTGL